MSYNIEAMLTVLLLLERLHARYQPRLDHYRWWFQTFEPVFPYTTLAELPE